MLKKLLAGLSAVSLGLGVVALTVAGPAVAASADSVPDSTTSSSSDTATSTPADSTPADPTPADSTPADPAPSASAPADSTAPAGQAPTVQLRTATPPADPVTENDQPPYLIVAWIMPTWLDAHGSSWPQTYFTSKPIGTRDLSALDDQLNATCGTQYQVDIYNNSAETAKVISQPQINPGQPYPEDFPTPNTGWGDIYKVLLAPDCPATATAVTTDGTCSATGTVTFAITDAHWVDAQGNPVTPSTSVGAHTVYAVADPGFRFPDGQTYGNLSYLTVTYTVADQLPWYECVPPPGHTDATCTDGVVGNGSITVTPQGGLSYWYTVPGSSTKHPISGSSASVPAGTYTVWAQHGSNQRHTLHWTVVVGDPQVCTVIAPPTLNCLSNVDADGNLVLGVIPGVLWKVDGVAQTGQTQPILIPLTSTDVHIEAVPASSSYGFKSGQTTWTFDADSAGACQIPTFADFPTNAFWSDPDCTTGNYPSGTLTVGDVQGVEFFTGEVDYFLDGSTTPMTTSTASLAPGAHTLTAAPHDPNDTLDGQTSWSFTVGEGALCPTSLKTLALTGTSSPAPWIGLGALLLMLGLGLVVVRNFRRDRQDTEQQ